MCIIMAIFCFVIAGGEGDSKNDGSVWWSVFGVVFLVIGLA